MSHLSAERLAALHDEPPAPDEVAHLAACADCARERGAYAALATLASAESARIDVPLTSWESLAPALHAEGIVAGGGIAAGTAHRRFRASVRWLQVAAGLLLVAGGAMLGRLSAGGTVVPGLAPADSSAASAATTAAASSGAHFESVAEAQQVRDSAAALFQQAITYLSRQDSVGGAATPAAMRTRLAALDHVSETMREALRLAPGDPVINGYYLTTLGQREATIRQLNTALPAGLRMQSF